MVVECAQGPERPERPVSLKHLGCALGGRTPECMQNHPDNELSEEGGVGEV